MADSLSIDFVEVNGQPGETAFGPDGAVIAVLALDIANGHVQAVRSIVNPAKLRPLGSAG